MRKTISILLWGVILVIYILLPILILIGIIPYSSKFVILTIGAVFIYIVSKLLGIKNIELGISKKNIKESIKTVIPITLIFGLLGIVIWTLGFSRISPNETWSFYIFYVFISSPIQEFLYRGAMPCFLSKLHFNVNMQMIISTLLYSFVHIIYKDIITLCLTFVIGIIWYKCYIKSKNLLGVSISHAVLGVITIIAGIID